MPPESFGARTWAFARRSKTSIISPRAAARPGAVHAVVAAVVEQRLLDVEEAVEVDVLLGEPDQRARAACVPWSWPKMRDLAGGDADEVADRADERRLARAVGAEQAEERAVGHHEVEAVEREEAVVVALGQAFEREGSRRGHPHLDVSVPVYPRGMRIGELARRAGVTTRTVRYYEGLGLLVSRREGGGHRQYDEDALARMAKIDWLKRMGLTLDEIAEVIPLYFGAQTSVRGRKKMIAHARAPAGRDRRARRGARRAPRGPACGDRPPARRPARAGRALGRRRRRRRGRGVLGQPARDERREEQHAAGRPPAVSSTATRTGRLPQRLRLQHGELALAVLRARSAPSSGWPARSCSSRAPTRRHAAAPDRARLELGDRRAGGIGRLDAPLPERPRGAACHERPPASSVARRPAPALQAQAADAVQDVATAVVGVARELEARGTPTGCQADHAHQSVRAEK